MADEYSEYDVQSLRVTRAEAREALNHQIDALDDVNDKAAQTLRLNVLLVGVVLTLASVLVSSNATPAIRRMTNGLVAAGVVVSAVSMVASMWVYTSTSHSAGTGPSDIRKFLSASPAEKEWLATLLYSYAAWMERNSRLNRRDGIVMFVAHACLFLSISYYVTGIAFGVFFPQMEWWLSVVVGVVLAILAVALLFAVRHRLGLRLVETI